MNVKSLISNNIICKRCVGRLYPQSQETLPDRSIKSATTELSAELLTHCSSESDCQICLGLVLISIDVAKRALNKLQDLEFSSFLVGCRVEKTVLEKQRVLSALNPDFIDIKVEIRREITHLLESELGKVSNYGIPEINILIDTQKKRYELDIRSLFILGRYFKYKRGLPQTKWPCSSCKGKGCVSCNFSGQQYPLTVETAISPIFIEASGARGAAFHGAGREDIDALMLGSGRPFVLELKTPTRRDLDLEQLQKEVNLQEEVDITDLQFSSKDVVIALKQGSPDSRKSYRAFVKVDTPLTDHHLTTLNTFGKETQMLDQRTPQRVSHRRADKVRQKSIMSVEAKLVDSLHLELVIEAQGGAYIKEFISGDEGRTIPSVSSLLEIKAKCVDLDVLAVDDQGVFSS